MPKLDQSDLLYRSKSPVKKVGVNRHFQASRASQPIGCLSNLHFFLLDFTFSLNYVFYRHRAVQEGSVGNQSTQESASVLTMSQASVARRDTAVTAILCYAKGFACACGLGTVHLFEKSEEDYFHPIRVVTVTLRFGLYVAAAPGRGSYLHNLISLQPPRSTRTSSVVTLSRPPASSSLKITKRTFRHASPHLWNKLPASLRQPCLNQSSSSSSSSSPPLSSSTCGTLDLVGVLV